MASVSFSLTEKFIIDPILTLRAPLDPRRAASYGAKAWQIVQSEVVTRVAGVFTSVMATLDTMIHVASTAYKGVALLAGASYTKSEVYAHVRQAAWFAGLTLVGSVVGALWPQFFQHCRYAPPPPPEPSAPLEPSASPELFADAPAPLRKLALAVQKEEEVSPFTELQAFWARSSLEMKHWFVLVFNQDGIPTFKAVRTDLAATVYRPISPLRARQVRWLSLEEVDGRAGYTIWPHFQACTQAFFYHATSERALESILKSGRVEVRHEKAFRGAFVSTQPELGFGRCILAFKRTIERLSPLEHGFQIGGDSYWAGFSRDIPVTESTLAVIMLDEGQPLECQDLATRCEKWSGRRIEVVPLQDARYTLKGVEMLDMGIPIEWPQEGEEVGNKILKTLRVRAAEVLKEAHAVAVPASQRRETVAVQRRQLAFAAH